MQKKLTAHIKGKGLLHIILSIIVVLVMIRHILKADYHSVFLCALTLLLFDIPLFVDKKLGISLPKELETIILLFIFSAEILGEIGSFYTHIPWWDSMLHIINGFLMAAIGFSLIDILNNSPKFHFNMSPIFVTFVAFCFSMTIGVLWEFFEFFMDYLTLTDMQKDYIIHDFASVTFNTQGINNEVAVNDISQTVITYANGQQLTIDGYLDIGIMDTMKDLFVNLIGAVAFSVVGYFYIVGRNKGIFAKKFIPQLRRKYTKKNVTPATHKDKPE